MEQIPKEVIETVLDHIDGLSSEKMNEMNYNFGKEQPVLTEYLTKEFDTFHEREVVVRCIFLYSVIFFSYQSYGRKLKMVDTETAARTKTLLVEHINIPKGSSIAIDKLEEDLKALINQDELIDFVLFYIFGEDEFPNEYTHPEDAYNLIVCIFLLILCTNNEVKKCLDSSVN